MAGGLYNHTSLYFYGASLRHQNLCKKKHPKSVLETKKEHFNSAAILSLVYLRYTNKYSFTTEALPFAKNYDFLTDFIVEILIQKENKRT